MRLRTLERVRADGWVTKTNNYHCTSTEKQKLCMDLGATRFLDFKTSNECKGEEFLMISRTDLIQLGHRFVEANDKCP